MEDRRSTWLLVIILTVAALLRAVGSNNSLWYDEIVTVRDYAREPYAVIVSKYSAANNHVMNSVLTHASIQAFGERPWTIRLPAVLFGIAGVWAFALVARRLWREDLALLGTALFAVSYHHVYYSQDARGYSAFVFFALLSVAALLRLLDASSPRKARVYGVIYALSLGLGTWALLLMAFVVAGQAMVLVIARRFNALWWLGGGVVVAALLYAPTAGPLVEYYANRPTDRPGVGFWFFLQELRPVALPLLVAAPVGALLTFRLIRRAPLQTSVLLMPLGLSIAIFPFVLGISLHPRTFIYGLPVAYLFVVEALHWCQPRFRWLVTAASAVMVAGSLVLLARFYPLPKQAFHEAIEYVAAHRRDGDQIVGIRLAGRAARFYDPSVIVAENLSETEQAVATSPRTWILTTFRTELNDGYPDLARWLVTSTSQETRLRSAIGDGDVQVRLYERK